MKDLDFSPWTQHISSGVDRRWVMSIFAKLWMKVFVQSVEELVKRCFDFAHGDDVVMTTAFNHTLKRDQHLYHGTAKNNSQK